MEHGMRIWHCSDLFQHRYSHNSSSSTVLLSLFQYATANLCDLWRVHLDEDLDNLESVSASTTSCLFKIVQRCLAFRCCTVNGVNIFSMPTHMSTSSLPSLYTGYKYRPCCGKIICVHFAELQHLLQRTRLSRWRNAWRLVMQMQYTI